MAVKIQLPTGAIALVTAVALHVLILYVYRRLAPLKKKVGLNPGWRVAPNEFFHTKHKTITFHAMMSLRKSWNRQKRQPEQHQSDFLAERCPPHFD